MPRQQPEQQAPPVQRLRIRYAKRGRMRFTSHRDFSRAFERAVFRARIPMAYSSGFNPHPRISYAGASPTGAASEAEFLEIGLSERVSPDSIKAALVESLPPGLDVLEVVESAGGSLMDLLTASRWQLDVTAELAEAEAAVAAFLGTPEVLVSRMTKRGLRHFDARGAIETLAAAPGPLGTRLIAVIRHQEPAVRPDDLLAGLREVSGFDPGEAPLLTRLAQGALDPETHEIGDPLAG